jgi:hypothetical protein
LRNCYPNSIESYGLPLARAKLFKVDHEKTSRFVWSGSGCSLHIPLVSMDSIAGFKLGDLRLWDGRGSSGGANVFVVERSQIDAQTCT